MLKRISSTTLKVFFFFFIHCREHEGLSNTYLAAALSITKLYRSSRKTSKRAYNAGYGAACQDLLTFIQQGVSASDLGTDSSHAVDGGGMTIGRVMDWTEARLEAIRTTEEEEEEEEREKERGTAQTTSRSPAATIAPTSPRSAARKLLAPRPKDTVSLIQSRDSSVVDILRQVTINPSRPPLEHSASSPPTSPLIVPSSISTKPLRPRTAPPQQNVSHAPFHPSRLSESIPANTNTAANVETPIVIGAGAKRRHAMMVMLDSGSSPITLAHGSGPSSIASSPGGVNIQGMPTTSSLGRRRNRSSRTLNQHQNQNINVIQVTPEAMDVEEDGRERKRVARR